MTEIRLEVDGLPPSKGEAKSVLGASHPHAPRVVMLLTEAQRVMAEKAFGGFGTRRLRLEVEMHAIPNPEPWDATNYLGGIADVLEVKTRRIANPQGLSLDHLGALLQVGLYEDDRQIKEITYREISSNVSRYVVILSPLESSNDL